MTLYIEVIYLRYVTGYNNEVTLYIEVIYLMYVTGYHLCVLYTAV